MVLANSMDLALHAGNNAGLRSEVKSVGEPRT